MENANPPPTNNHPVLPDALRAPAVQELYKLQRIPAFVDSRLESIERFLNDFANQPNETNTNNLESNEESVDTHLVSPFPHSDNDSNDGEVLSELIEYENVGMLRREKEINSFDGDNLVEQDKQVLKRLVYLLESHLFDIYNFNELAKVLATWCSELGSKSSKLEKRVSVASYRYIDTKPNNELIHYCLQNPPYKFKWTKKTIPVAEGSSETTTEGYMENYKNVSQDIRDQLNAEAEAVQIILTGIDNDIYSTVDACPNACEMWKAIERLKQGRKAHLLEDKQILMFLALGWHLDDVASIKQRLRDLFNDGVWNLETASGRGQLKEDLESST
ncbi:hypothetical protein Tco_0383011 [Tanacetum coccineum]